MLWIKEKASIHPEDVYAGLTLSKLLLREWKKKSSA
jgi:hypothetical protein